MVEFYRNVVERLLVTLSQDEEEAVQVASPSPVLTNNEDANVWPPWPWPPWGGDEDGEKKPINRTLEAQKLAKKVVKFETQLARASLDL